MLNRDPGLVALAREAQVEAPGTIEKKVIEAGDGWHVSDITCTFGPRDPSFEERYAATSISLVLSGTFVHRSDHGSVLMSPGSLLLGNAGHSFECSHQYGAGDRCVSFQFDPELFERVAHDAGAAGILFDHSRLPPLRVLAPLIARATAAAAGNDSFEEVALELAAAAIQVANRSHRRAPSAAGDRARVARVLRRLESSIFERHTLASLAHTAGLSRYHFLRTFKSVTGVTPHQWLLRTRLREAARRLAANCAPVTAIALDVGFDDLSNFIRSFRAEFGVSPSRYRASA